MADSTEGAAFDTWDWMRAQSWELMAGDHLVTTLPDLYAVLGVAYQGHDAKIAALRAFMATPAWHPAPEGLKQQAQEALRGG